MAGPWYVDPDNGSTSNPGTEALPWKHPPSSSNAASLSQSGYGVVANDTIYIKNGTTYDANTYGRILPPVSGLRYIGYGLAPNVLVLELPGKFRHTVIAKAVAREWGVHEGMWTIDASTNNVSGGAAISTGTRTDCVFEDVDIIGPAVGTRDAVGLASSTDNVAGFAMRRFRIRGATARGIAAYTKAITLEWGQVHYTQDDNIGLMASTANGYRSGGESVLRYLDLKDPNRAYEGAANSGSQGDCIQSVMSSAAAQWNEKLTISNVLFTKNTAGKQVCTFADASGGITLDGFHSRGSGSSQIVHANLRGALTIKNGHWDEFAGQNDNMLIRFEGITTPSVAYGMDTGSLLDVSNLSVRATRMPGVYHCTETAAAWTFDGAIKLRHITAVGAINDNGFSFGAGFAFWSSTSTVTFGSNFTLSLENNCIQAPGKPAVILPPGQENNARWSVRNNRFDPESDYRFGAVSYATKGLFEAAHSYASGNITADPRLVDRLVPTAPTLDDPGSPLLGAGLFVSLAQRDIRGTQRRLAPTIGAFDQALFRYLA